MGGNGKEPMYQIIGIRKNGERTIISSHSTEEVAEKVVKLLKGGDFADIRVEEKPPTKRKA